MLKKPKLIVIYDTDDAFTLANEIFKDISSFEFDANMSRTIKRQILSPDKVNEEQTFDTIVNSLKEINIDGLVIILDMNLGLSDTIIGELAKDFGIDRGSTLSQCIDGLCVGHVALRNVRISKLMICPSTTNMALYEEIEEKFNSSLDDLNRHKDSFHIFMPEKGRQFYSLSYGTSQDEAIKIAKKLIRQIEQEWKEAFPSISLDNLKDALFRASLSSDKGHPHNSEALTDTDIFCYTELKESLSSYKALYHVPDNCKSEMSLKDYQDCIKEGRCSIKVSIFNKILEYVGIQIETNEALEQFQLPIRIGMLFIIGLVDFLDDINERELILSQDANRKQAILRIQMSNDVGKSVRIFQAAFNTGLGGKSIKKFRNLLACRVADIRDYFGDLSPDNAIVKKILKSRKEDHEMYESVKVKLLEEIDEWVPYKLKKGEGHSSPDTFLDIIEYEFHENAIVLKWDSVFQNSKKI
jgi:hypothetical protein